MATIHINGYGDCDEEKLSFMLNELKREINGLNTVNENHCKALLHLENQHSKGKLFDFGAILLMEKSNEQYLSDRNRCLRPIIQKLIGFFCIDKQ